MSKPSSGLFSKTQGTNKSIEQTKLNLSSMQGNLSSLSKTFPTTPSGYFGEKGSSTKVRVIKTNNQYKSAQKFWETLAKGGKVAELPNKHGLKVDFEDGSFATYRVKTSTKSSPAVEIRITKNDKFKPQKIHFVKKGRK
jgi:hypothetical protein